MAARARRQRVLLSLLGLVLAAILISQFWPGSGPAGTGAAPSTARGTQPSLPDGANGRRGAAAGVSQVVDVGVAKLELPPTPVGSSGRNPFRFQPKAAAPPPVEPIHQAPVSPPPTAAVDPSAPVALPPPPPITLKFIGVVTGQTKTGKVAALSDGKFVYYGREGDIIEGRYRVVKIGEESVQLEYVDGRGRQTIRLSGA